MSNETFLPLCADETAVLDALLLLLQEEQQAILRFDAIRIEALVEVKLAGLERLRQCKSHRMAWLEARQLDTQDAFAQWLSGVTPDVLQAWQGVEHALVRVQTQNDMNAVTASEHIAFADEAVTALREGLKALDGYGRNGQFSSGLGAGRRLGSA